MRFVFALSLLLIPAVFSASLSVAPRGGTIVPNEFIVTMNKNTNMPFSALEANVENILYATKGKMLHRYSSTIKGFAVRVDADGLDKLKAIPDVDIEANLVFHAVECHEQKSATWGLVRTSEHELKVDGQYFYGNSEGEGVDAYILDTGINTQHVDFEGRATWGLDTVENPSPKTDENGHGSHVAGTVGSKTWGVAKKVSLIAVRVLNKAGSGTTAGIIAGIDWVTEQHKAKKNGRPTVANMSIGGGYSKALNNAVDDAVDAGIGFVVSAGNENHNACDNSPASAEHPITVGATDNQDARSYFSNWGKCVDIFAPGTDITSTWMGSKTATKTISGTSMASPHVCGVLARYFGAHPTHSPQDAKEFLEKTSTKGVISDVRTGSPNKLLYAGCEF